MGSKSVTCTLQASRATNSTWQQQSTRPSHQGKCFADRAYPQHTPFSNTVQHKNVAIPVRCSSSLSLPHQHRRLHARHRDVLRPYTCVLQFHGVFILFPSGVVVPPAHNCVTEEFLSLSAPCGSCVAAVQQYSTGGLITHVSL
jgi:hypothetical protein